MLSFNQSKEQAEMKLSIIDSIFTALFLLSIIGILVSSIEEWYLFRMFLIGTFLTSLVVEIIVNTRS